MFDNLTNKLQDALKKLRGQAVISESNIAPAMNDIREALLEADVSSPERHAGTAGGQDRL